MVRETDDFEIGLAASKVNRRECRANSGATALSLAAQNGDREVVELLTNAGALCPVFRGRFGLLKRPERWIYY